MTRTLFLTAIAMVLATGCRSCGPPLRAVEPAQLALDAVRLDFPPTWVGLRASQTLHLSNAGRVSAEVEARTTAPFFADTESLRVAGGATEEVTVDFAPTVVGEAVGLLTVGEFSVELHGKGLAIPECRSESACQTSAFDQGAAACVARPTPDGEGCSELCLIGGRCESGICVGAPKDCADETACTLDACGAGGCTHEPVTCPSATGLCRVAKCDSTLG